MKTRLIPMLALLGLFAICTNASAADRVQSVSVDATPPLYSGPCPAQITFTAIVVAESAYNMVAVYQWQRSDGAIAAPQKIELHPGKNVVTTTWTLGGAALPNYEGWQSLRILEPNAIESAHANFKMVCEGKPQASAQGAPAVAGSIPMGSGSYPPAACGNFRPDPKVTNLTITSVGTNEAQITATVTNIGKDQPVVAAPQEIHLFRNGSLLNRQTVPRLVAGQSYTATFRAPAGHGTFSAIYVPEPDSTGLLDCDVNNDRMDRKW